MCKIPTYDMSQPFRYTTAVVRGVPASLPKEAQRMSPTSTPVSYEEALKQINNYIDILRNKVGLHVIELPADDSQPDCVFVEDTVVAIGNRALITNPGHESRRPEIVPMAECLRELGMDLVSMKEKDPNARMDGGDVLFTGKEIFVGISARTNEAGLKVLADTFPAYPVSPVPVQGVLHLKSGCSLAGPGAIFQAVGTSSLQTMATNLEAAAKEKYSFIKIDGDFAGANCLYIDSVKRGSTIVHQPFNAFPKSQEAYEKLENVTRLSCDLSEFGKVDGALTCCSILLTI